MDAKKSRPEVGVNGNWACGRCDNVNFGTRTECNICKTQPDGNWLCTSCSNLNFPHREECNRCKNPRPAGGTPGKGANMGYNQMGGGAGAGAGPGFGGQQQAYGTPAANAGYGLAMQLVAMFQGGGGQDPFFAAAQYVASLGGAQGMGGGGQGMGGGGQGMAGQGGFAQKRLRTAPVAGDRGNWACASCNNVNFQFRDECNKCKAPKAAESTQ